MKERHFTESEGAQELYRSVGFRSEATLAEFTRFRAEGKGFHFTEGEGAKSCSSRF